MKIQVTVIGLEIEDAFLILDFQDRPQIGECIYVPANQIPARWVEWIRQSDPQAAVELIDFEEEVSENIIRNFCFEVVEFRFFNYEEELGSYLPSILIQPDF